jgi:Polyketide cyclase / dehydrase and lipid transport
MSEPAWEVECSVEADVSLRFAWAFWTNIANWVDPPATFELDGPFASGARGTTRLPGQPPFTWVVTDVQPERSFTTELALQGASFLAERRFEALPGGRTRLTQRLELRGENADAYVEGCRAGFEPNLEPGMTRIADAMARAAAAAGER